MVWLRLRQDSICYAQLEIMATAEPPDIRLPNQASMGDLPEGADPFAPESSDSVEVAVSQPPPVVIEDDSFLTDALLAAMLVLLVLLALTSIRLLKLREIIRRNRDEVVSVRDEARQLRRMLADAEEKAEARIRKRTGKLLETAQHSQRERDQLSSANKQLREMMRSDPLTGLANSRYFHHRLETELRRALRSRQLVALILCDLDGFSEYNEKHGHDKGDLLLNSVARLVRKHFRRGGDITARLDADQFAIIAPDTNFEDAVQHAMKLHRQIRRLDTAGGEQAIEERMTASIGVICISPTRLHPPQQVIERARGVLKLAKDRGRDRVAGDPGSPAERMPRHQREKTSPPRKEPPAQGDTSDGKEPTQRLHKRPASG